MFSYVSNAVSDTYSTVKSCLEPTQEDTKKQIWCEYRARKKCLTQFVFNLMAGISILQGQDAAEAFLRKTTVLLVHHGERLAIKKLIKAFSSAIEANCGAPSEMVNAVALNVADSSLVRDSREKVKLYIYNTASSCARSATPTFWLKARAKLYVEDLESWGKIAEVVDRVLLKPEVEEPEWVTAEDDSWSSWFVSMGRNIRRAGYAARGSMYQETMESVQREFTGAIEEEMPGLQGGLAPLYPKIAEALSIDEMSLHCKKFELSKWKVSDDKTITAPHENLAYIVQSLAANMAYYSFTEGRRLSPEELVEAWESATDEGIRFI